MTRDYMRSRPHRVIPDRVLVAQSRPPQDARGMGWDIVQATRGIARETLREPRVAVRLPRITAPPALAPAAAAHGVLMM